MTQQVRALQLFQGLLAGQDKGVRVRRRQGAGARGRQAAAVGVEAAKPQPLGQAAQGLVHQEFHGPANPPGSQLSRAAGFWFFGFLVSACGRIFPKKIAPPT